MFEGPLGSSQGYCLPERFNAVADKIHKYLLPRDLCLAPDAVNQLSDLSARPTDHAWHSSLPHGVQFSYLQRDLPIAGHRVSPCVC